MSFLPLAFSLFNNNNDPCGLFKACSDKPGQAAGSHLAHVVNLLIFAAGFIAVIMIIIAGFNYAMSGGDEKKVEAAKNTIIYAVIGLIVVVMAYTIVHFVLAKI